MMKPVRKFLFYALCIAISSKGYGCFIIYACTDNIDIIIFVTMFADKNGRAPDLNIDIASYKNN